MTGSTEATAGEFDETRLDSALDQVAVLALEGRPVEPAPKQFVPRGLDQATRLMRRLAVLRARQQEISSTAHAQIERIREWAAHDTAVLDKQTAWLEFLLQNYHAAELERDPRRKTISTPYGDLKARAVAPEPYVEDEGALTPWATAAGFVEMKPLLRWADLKKAVVVAADGRVLYEGEPVPGVGAKPARTEFRAKPEGVESIGR